MSKKSKYLDCLDGKLLPTVVLTPQCYEDLSRLSSVLHVEVSDLIADSIKLYLLSFQSINRRICDAVGSCDCVGHVESKD